MEKAVETSVGFLLENVYQLIKDNYELISNNGTKVDQLSKDIRMLKLFMNQYTEKHYQNEILRELANDIRSLVYEIEDVIETFVVNELLYRKRGAVGKVVHGFGHLNKLSNLGEKIQELSDKVKTTYDENKDISMHALALEEMERNEASQENNETGDQREDRIIGFQDATAEVIQLLTGKLNTQEASELEQQSKPEAGGQQSKPEAGGQSELMQLEVSSICGMLGLGKTTLAKKVLNDPRIEYHFFTRLFASVSNEYKKKEVLLSILSFFEKNIRDHNHSDKELAEMLKEKLRHKYLIVLDDVWTKEAWDDLIGVFPDYKNGSRLLITTRDNYVAEYSSTNTKPYNLRFMTNAEGRELLRTKVFGVNECPVELQPVETGILRKCGGLPLAIVVTAGILRNNKKDKGWWEDVLVGEDIIVANDHRQTDKLIRRSYDNLPSHLKPCFLYLGVFPEDMEIQVSKLFLLWIAEGFIQLSRKSSLEKVAEHYLRELVGRNLVMVGKRTSSGRIKTCQVHDTLRDFCKKTAQQENLFQEVDKDTVSSSGRRLCCMYNHIPGYISRKPSAESARSFLSFAQEEILLQKDLCPLLFKPFKLLRVLDILSIKLTGRFPNELPSLFLLKYIAIAYDIGILPEKMSRLLNLQTIIIHTASPTLEIKTDIWKMPHLRHVHINTSTSLPMCQGQPSASENIQTLTTIAPESLVDEVFGKIKNIKKLGIRGNLSNVVETNGESSLFDRISNLEFLENLKLRSDHVNAKLRALPPMLKFPVKLTRLSLQNTSLDWSHMSTLGKLKVLEVLKLKDNAFKGNHWRTEDGGFRGLKVLYIGATDLVVWEAEASNFPILKCLILKHCNILEAIPAGFADIKSLEMINLECTNNSVVSSGRKIQLLQLQMLRQQRDNETSAIKLSVYPPEL